MNDKRVQLEIFIFQNLYFISYKCLTIPISANTPMLSGILQQRIELDKECMFQYTQLRKEVRPYYYYDYHYDYYYDCYYDYYYDYY